MEKQRKMRQDMKKENANKGITLIALVITIIVLLILAGVSIATLTGNNGILTQANNSKTQTAIGEEKEAIGLAYNGAKIEKLGGTITADDLNSQFTKNGVNATASGSGTIKVAFPNTNRIYIIDNNGTVSEFEPVVAGGIAKATVKDNYIDANNEKATIPKGFTVSATENTINTGLVVIAPDIARSEFVWVPVDSSLRAGGTTGKEMAVKASGKDENGRDNYQGKLYDFTGTGGTTTSNLKTGYGQGTTSNREPSLVTGNSADTSADVASVAGGNYDADSQYYNTILGYTSSTGVIDFRKDMQKDYNAMIESVKTYGGFYIGRYETSINGATVASIKGNEDTRPMSAGAGSGNTWYGMYKKQKEFASKNSISSVKSSMIWGSQYDAMLNWALGGSDKAKVTATTNVPHSGLSGTYQPGTQSNDKINNIYDLEGNIIEWTLEANNTNSRVYRGRWLRLQ